ncbi:hypothetical protein WKW77_23640 [Variovorax ureilyticus]|uniref:Uncharacterized protein n=1 Tax=Variovorax ureilyticus TaxID=1836198 RepID=A0ABU8VKB8_9BURK
MRVLAVFFATAFSVLISHANERAFFNIKIIESGVSANEDAIYVKGCKSFKPTPKQIQRYFLNAYPAPHWYGLHDRYSPCFANGTADAPIFGKVKWAVDSGGFGSITWGDDVTVYVFHKKNGWFDPAACTYGLGHEGEC